ncbi:hypothetical protein FSP39_009411 [Pinctada imbricata]|uniref:Uncharacterized protein n=1 Tax=Pinctada imbricata TaxID=66713 RepID=A0AA89BZ90_PINIB|nr:hypothetical protein FSP39_009411 [Pinctada imbricata]
MTTKSEYDLHTVLFSNYSSDIRPVNDEKAKLTINVTAFLTSIVGLDEPSGQLVTTMAFVFTWIDIGLLWSPDDYDGRTNIYVDFRRIWTPPIFLLNPSQSLQRLGNEGGKTPVRHDGLVTWSVGGIMHSTCHVDVTYFPFDEQKCLIKFNAFEYEFLIEYQILQSSMNMLLFTENGVWQVEKTEVTTYQYTIICTLYLKRRSTFYQLNIITPIMILVFLNSMVFLLPAESGERVGFAVTILLSVSVYMTIIADSLPSTSKPVSILNYVLIFFLTQSAVICIKTIIGIRMYAKADLRTTSTFLHGIVKLFKSGSLVRVCEDRKVHIDNDTKDGSEKKAMGIDCKTTQDENDRNAITWTLVAEAFDRLSLCVNLILTIVVVVAFIVVIVRGTKH